MATVLQGRFHSQLVRPTNAGLFLATTGALLLTATSAFGALSLPAGRTLLRTAVSAYAATEYYDATGEVLDGDWWDAESEFGSVELRQSLEYGLRDDLSLLVDTRFATVTADRNSGRRDDQFAGLGDVGVGLRKRLPAKSVEVAVQGKVELPGGYDGEREDYALGAGEINGEGRFLISGAIGSWSSSNWAGNVGYRLRGGSFDDDIVFGLSAGIPIVGAFRLNARADGVSNLRSEPLDLETMSGSDPRRHASYLRAGGGLGIAFTDSARLDVGIAADIAGENTLRGTSFDLSFEFRP